VEKFPVIYSGAPGLSSFASRGERRDPVAFFRVPRARGESLPGFELAAEGSIADASGMETLLPRAQALSATAAAFPLLGPLAVDDLLGLVGVELGDPEILDGFRPYGNHWARARALSPLLHIVSGNTPHAALQSLIRGLLIGAENWVKIPGEGLPEVERFIDQLPPALRNRVRFARELPPEWLRAARAVVVFGSDETLAHFRKRISPAQRFLEHGHRLSLALVLDDPHYRSLVAAARDISVFDQKGCLSPHGVYVREKDGLTARIYAEKLADALADYDARDPRGPLTRAETLAIFDLRTNYQFRAAADPRVRIWTSPGNDHWTVIYEDDPWFASSCLNRTVFVKPLPADFAATLRPVRPWLSAAGVWPARPEDAEWLAALGFTRICPLGKMQLPPATWHQDGAPVLTNLIEWVDFEPETG